MTQKTHKTIYAALSALVVIGTFEGLIAILNLNQVELYFKTAFYAGLFFVFQIILLYDLHYKSRGSLDRAKKRHESMAGSFLKNCKIVFYALADRCAHLLLGKFVRRWFNYLILPGLIFWGSICVFYLNFGFPKTQQLVLLFSSAAFFVNYLYLKEIFSRGKEVVDRDIFIILSVVKIYACVLVYAAALGLVRSHCLGAPFLTLAIFTLTFLLIYQALFQHRLVNHTNLGITLLISLVMSAAGYLVLVFWGYNYFTGAVLLTALYNMLWGTFHYHLDRALTWRAFWEILIISAIVAAMLFSATNFKARVFNSCEYKISL